MIKTQVQLPDELYHTAKAIAEQREWSLAEVVRRGIECMALAYPLRPDHKLWELPILKEEDFRHDLISSISRHWQRGLNSGQSSPAQNRHQFVAQLTESGFRVAQCGGGLSSAAFWHRKRLPCLVPRRSISSSIRLRTSNFFRDQSGAIRSSWPPSPVRRWMRM